MALTDGSPQSIFQLVLLGIFAALAVGGLIMLAMFKTESDTVVSYPITIWGPPMSGTDLGGELRTLAEKNPLFEKIQYVSKNPLTLQGDIVEAIALGRAPDMVVLDQTSLIMLKNKLYPVPYETYPISTYRSTFLEGAELFTDEKGIYAFPFAVDPLIMFWNRDLFANAAIAQVPTNWDTFISTSARLTKIVGDTDIVQAGIAFGEYDNVLHAKEILSALMLQAGVPIVKRAGSKYYATFGAESGSQTAGGALLALRFYTDFANPVKKVYSWNKLFPRSREAFASNKVAMCAGFVSEIRTLTQLNPNLNFDVMMWPQSVTPGAPQVTYGKFYGLAILNSSRYKARAYQVAQLFSGKSAATAIARATLLPTTRRDSLTEDATNPFSNTIVRSAIIAKSWPEPQQQGVNDVFATLVNDVVAGKSEHESALGQARQDLEVLLTPYQ